MKQTDIHSFLSTVYQEVTGQADVLKEDLSNIVDVGATLMDNQTYKDAYVRAMFNTIGRWEFVERPYVGAAPDIERKDWEWGSIMSKSRTKDTTPTTNPSWHVQPGDSVDQYVFTPPEVQTTLFNEAVDWEIDVSFMNKQLKQSFNDGSTMDRFLSMIRSKVNEDQTAHIDELKMRAINNFIGYRIARNRGVYDVLTAYNSRFSQSLTEYDAPYDKDFLRFYAYQILLYKSRMRRRTANFIDNDPGYTSFTPEEYNRIVLLDVFGEAMKVYLQSDTFHDDMIKIGKFDTVSRWQGTGMGVTYPFAEISQINIEVSGLSGSNTVARSGIAGLMFDRDAIGIINEDREIEVAYDARGQYWNNFYKVVTRLYNDPAENGLIFVLGQGTLNSITLDKHTAKIAPAGTTTLTATVVPAGSTVTWTTSKASVATVSSGTVTGVADGTATITATITVDGYSYSDSCVVTVETETQQNQRKK